MVKRETGVIHPKEREAIRIRAKWNVQTDLELLINAAVERSKGPNKRIKYLGTCEQEYLTELMAHLETLP